jgi:hypothetical protein
VTNEQERRLLAAHSVQVLDGECRVIVTTPAVLSVEELHVQLTPEEAEAARFLRLLDKRGRIIAVAPARASLVH